jgi:hypothetical protein
MTMTHSCSIFLLFTALAVTGCNQAKPDPAPQQAEVEKIVSILTAKDMAAAESTGAAATGWGTFKGKITVSAKPAPLKDLTCNKDEGTCCREKLVDNSIVTGSGNGLANVFVFLRSKGKTPVRVHEDYAKKEGTDVVLNNVKCMFEPHCAAIWTKQKLQLKNSDAVGHNTKFDSPLQGFNDILNSGGAPLEKTFKAGENKPSGLSCSIHPWMKGNLLIRDNPYFALTNDAGEFEIPNMPAGEELEISFWHERNDKLTKVSGTFQLKNGVLKLKLPENQATEVAFVVDPSDLGVQ